MLAIAGELLQREVQFKEGGAHGHRGQAQLGRLAVAVVLSHDAGDVLVQFLAQLAERTESH